MLVDDEAMNLLILETAIVEERLRVFEAADGIEALEHFEEKECPDLVLMDLMMPRWMAGKPQKNQSYVPKCKGDSSECKGRRRAFLQEEWLR